MASYKVTLVSESEGLNKTIEVVITNHHPAIPVKLLLQSVQKL